MKNETKLTIRQWAESDRPREKFLDKGKSSLSDAELIAILIGNGTAKESALDLAKRILVLNNNSLNQLANKSIDELTAISGIGPAKSITLQAAFELGQRRRAEKVERKKQIQSSADIQELMQRKFDGINHEEFWVLFLNNGAALLKIENVGKGGLTSTTVDVRIIMKRAVELCATALVLCHNHPSGDIKPSQADIRLTQQIKNAAQFLDLKILDHIILGKENYYSFLAEGIL
ncbi:MAG: DNA repair protein RadC [Bacteroidales bacterium]|nr:DNA repair protein RadC [Bacteroidales bacterium]